MINLSYNGKDISLGLWKEMFLSFSRTQAEPCAVFYDLLCKADQSVCLQQMAGTAPPKPHS